MKPIRMRIVQSFNKAGMAQVTVNNLESSVNDVEATRDGYYVKSPNGRLRITQKALKALDEAKARVEKLHSLILSGIAKGGDVEAGLMEAAILEIKGKSMEPIYRARLITEIGEPAVKKLVADTPAKKNPRLRTWATTGKKPSGKRLAPTVDGSAIKLK